MKNFKNMQTRMIVPVLVGTIFVFVGARLWLPLAPTVGLVTKVVKEVTHKPGDEDWHKAKVGQPLSNGDLLKTGQKSIAIVKFVDNNVLRVRSRSELKIFGEKAADGTFSKNVQVDRGKIGFSVEKQENEQFTFTSPTSVASIRGSDGSFTSEIEGDTLTMLTGLADLTSQLTGQTQSVTGRQTGTVNALTGQITVGNSTQIQQNGATGANSDPNIREIRLRTTDGRYLIIEIDDQRP